MTKRILLSLVASTMLVSSGAFAQATDVAGHPRVNEVDNRLQDQETRTTNGVNGGTINAKQEARDTARDAKVSQEVSADEAKNGGHLTKGEQRHMNKQLNANSKDIHRQRNKPAATTTTTTGQ